MNYTLDTNSVIYYVGKDPHGHKLLKTILSSDHKIFISTITELELYSGRDLSFADIEILRIILYPIHIISLSSEIAHCAAAIRRQTKIATPDSAIAATAILTNSTLLTRNVKDFKDISNLKLQEI